MALDLADKERLEEFWGACEKKPSHEGTVGRNIVIISDKGDSGVDPEKRRVGRKTSIFPENT